MPAFVTDNNDSNPGQRDHTQLHEAGQKDEFIYGSGDLLPMFRQMGIQPAQPQRNPEKNCLRDNDLSKRNAFKQLLAQGFLFLKMRG
jgi:hypothetical protein